MKRRVLALVLVLAMALSAMPVGTLAVSEFNEEHSSSAKDYLKKYDQVNTHTFEVPCMGKVEIDVSAARDSTMMMYTFTLKEGGKELKEEMVFLSKKEKTFWSGSLSAGTYTVEVKWTYGSTAFQNTFPTTAYYIDWNFYCQHENRTEELLSDPTCSEEGEIQYVCDDCGEIASTKKIDKLPHTPDGNWVTVKEPTCSEAGKRTQTCTVCGQTAQEETLKRLEHTYGDWEVIKKATCSENGEERRFCSVCGTGDSHPIIFGDHDFGEWEVTKKATCDTAGSRTRKCLLCGKEERETDPRLEHDFSGWTTVEEKTCLKDGSEERVCRLCGKKETRTLEAEGHDYGPWVREGEMEVQTCSVCGKKERKEAGSEQVLASYLGAVDSEYMTLRAIHFADVAETSWYHQDVRYAYSLGIMQGNSDTIFNPAGNMTLAEAITMAARVYKKYCLYGNPYPDSEEFPPTKVWYETYVNYAIRNGIIKADSFDDYERPATRAEMAYIFTNAAMEDEYKKEFRLRSINTVEKLPDVQETDRYGKEIFTLYRAGVLTGQDKQGTFSPDSPITRAEAAAIITRVALKNMRKTLELK